MPLLKPKAKDVVIHPFEQEEMTTSGLLYVQKRKERRQNQGLVVAKGKEVPEEIEITDHVIFSGYTGDKISFEDGGVFFVIPWTHIDAIIENSDVKFFDSKTLKVILLERKGQLLTEQYHGKDKKIRNVVEEVFESIIERIDSHTMDRGFEW